MFGVEKSIAWDENSMTNRNISQKYWHKRQQEVNRLYLLASLTWNAPPFARLPNVEQLAPEGPV